MKTADVEKAQKIQFINRESEEIFYKKDHVFIGISPSNSYYSESRIAEILFWVLEQGFRDFTVFLADEISYYNWLKWLADGINVVRLLSRWFWNHQSHCVYQSRIRIIDETIAFFGESKRA